MRSGLFEFATETTLDRLDFADGFVVSEVPAAELNRMDSLAYTSSTEVLNRRDAILLQGVRIDASCPRIRFSISQSFLTKRD